MPKRLKAMLAATALGVSLAAPAAAWTRPGHMVTAAIAWDEIARKQPALLAELGTLLSAHPDRGAFQVAIDRTTGVEQARRMFLECARWPDDARGTVHDQPSWHATMKPVLAADAPAGVRADATYGQAIEALRLNYAVLANRRAEAHERARALCWILHVAGDIHQPLHTAELFSAAYPQGDGGGAKQFVKDPLTGESINLHWLWDDSVHRSGAAADVYARAAELQKRWSRSAIEEDRAPADTSQFTVWAQESYALAQSSAYGAGMPTSSQAETAPAVPDRLWRDVRSISERRVTLAGYRIADLVMAALGAGG